MNFVGKKDIFEYDDLLYWFGRGFMFLTLVLFGAVFSSIVWVIYALRFIDLSLGGISFFDAGIVNVLLYALFSPAIQILIAKYRMYNDYKKVAEELGIDIATMKAVVEIEAGSAHQGFAEPGIPLVNFDLVIFKRFMRKAGKSYAKYTKSAAFQRPNTKKYGSYGKAQWARLESARKIDKEIAEKATFWGMFQIGGFNWKQCGCKSLDEFISRMSESEAEQLELFAQFCKTNNLVRYLKAHDWNNFAYRYNGPGYKKRNYHIKLRQAHSKHSK